MTNEEKARWLAQAEAYLKRLQISQAVDMANTPLQTKKLARLKTYQALIKMDTIFKDLGGAGLIAFKEIPPIAPCPACST